MSPTVSIILPTYNRARFLPQAIASICSQQWTDWELIIVDDGSTDETAAIIGGSTSPIQQPVTFIQQENRGAYGARNTGLDHATGKYIAFFDSDDEWLPHHLQDCVHALESNADVDWVYGACRMVDEASGNVISANTFYTDRGPRPFLALKTRASGRLLIIDDPQALECMVTHGLYNGLQNSVLRSALFAGYRFDFEDRNEAEDQLAVIRALLGGHVIGYFDNVHVNYKVHDANSSAAGGSQDLARQERVINLMIAGYERLYRETKLSPQVRRAIRKRLGRDCFWAQGYATLWQAGKRPEALRQFRRGIHYWPWDWRCWKTLVVSSLKRGSKSHA